MSPILDVSNLSVAFGIGERRRRVLDSVNLSVRSGTTLAVVGESGSGKTTLGLSIAGLLSNDARVESGQVRFSGRDLLQLSERELEAVRGQELGIALEEPRTALDPFATIGTVLARAARGVRFARASARAVELLAELGMDNPARHLRDYPHELSEGHCQRVLLAMALLNEPKLAILDEPTTGLDPTSQAHLIDSLQNLQHRTGLSLVLITHDLGLVAEMADDVVVLYAGSVVERGPVSSTLERPAHPYTRGLLASIPPLHASELREGRRLPTIPGSVERHGVETGCRFRLRCAYRQSEPQGKERCDVELPELDEIAPEQYVRCHFARELA